MIPDADERITKLKNFLQLIDEWERSYSEKIRAQINQTKNSVEREAIEAGCSYKMTIGPPPGIGGLLMRNVNPFDMIFDTVYLRSLNSHVKDMINQTIGSIEERRNQPDIEIRKRNEPELIKRICICGNAYRN